MSAILASAKKVVRVREILTHMRPDWDAVVAICLLIQYGKSWFEGIESAVIRFVTNGVLGGDEDHDKNGIVVVDVGHNCRFSDKSSARRKAGECATVLVAIYLEITGRPELARLLKETADADNKDENTVTCMPALAKVAHRSGAAERSVFDYMMYVVKAIITQEMYNYAPVAGEKSLREWFDFLVAEEGSVLDKTGRVHDWMARKIEESVRLKDERVIELAHVVECLYRVGGFSEVDMKEFLLFWFGMMQADQKAFWAEEERIRPLKKKMIEAHLIISGFGDRSLDVLVLDGTDSPHALKAAMYDGHGVHGADIVVVRTKSSNVQIYTRKGWRTEGLSLDRLWKAICWHELGFEDRKKTNVDSFGGVTDTDRWYYFKLGGCIFNGSLTHQRERTTIPLKVLVELIQYCLSEEGFNRLCALRGMRPAKNSPKAGSGGNGEKGGSHHSGDLRNLINRSAAAKSAAPGLRELEQAIDQGRTLQVA